MCVYIYTYTYMYIYAYTYISHSIGLTRLGRIPFYNFEIVIRLLFI